MNEIHEIRDGELLPLSPEALRAVRALGGLLTPMLFIERIPGGWEYEVAVFGQVAAAGAAHRLRIQYTDAYVAWVAEFRNEL